MMLLTILFLLAVFFAWPTYGLTLLVFFGLAYYLITNERSVRSGEHESRLLPPLQPAMRIPKVPTWCSDQGVSAEFTAAIMDELAERHIPASYLEASFADRSIVSQMLSHAARAEARGKSFMEQQEGVSDLLTRMWDSLPTSQKRRFARLDESARR